MNHTDNPRAVIGGNAPPSPFDEAEKAVNDAYEEAALWLDGAEVADQDTADGLSNLLAVVRAAEKMADAARVEEKRPHDEAAKAVQAKYKPLLDKAKRAADGCKTALAKWLAKVEAEKRAAAEAAHAEAAAKRREAEAAIRASDAANLAEREAAEAKLKEAKKAEAKAAATARDTAKAGGGMGRAVGLRTVHIPVMTDATAAARHYWKAQPEAMREFLQGLADKDVRAGAREIPGFKIREEKRAQ